MALYGLLLYILTTPIAYGVCYSTVQITAMANVQYNNISHEKYRAPRNVHDTLLLSTARIKLSSKLKNNLIYYSKKGTFEVGTQLFRHIQQSQSIYVENRPDINLPTLFVHYRF